VTVFRKRFRRVADTVGVSEQNGNERNDERTAAERVAMETARELMGLWSMLHRLNGSSEYRAFGLAYRDVERYLGRCGFVPELVQETLTTIQFEYPEPEF